ncbi:GntR family transcriptional regulator [Streptomyces turgidiscabies]|uniref:GntR family transcriptional regulator n=1 Tax=Streptomyces turgidiscabies TaxID=85558 RepID=UPI0029BF21E3|nr:GntR family transcriptional regulator [Streptomyces turgidiscabies]MDX3493230.1 GntR family transcriptional regulator [Streptomyces turgidiscabies]
MPDRDLPPCRQIADDLRQDIATGKLAPGEKLESENELKDRYGTTRVTVRKALSLLKADGLLISEQGRGVFVRPQPRVRLRTTGANFRERRSSGVSNFNAEAAAQGLRADQRILSVARVPAPAEVAERIGIPAGSSVIIRRRAFFIGDEPMQLADGYYPEDLFTGSAVEEPRRIPGGVSALIEDPAGPVGQRIVRFVEDLDIRMPTPAEVDALRIPPGVPVARVLRSTCVQDGRVVEVLDSLVPCDRHLFQYVIDVP